MEKKKRKKKKRRFKRVTGMKIVLVFISETPSPFSYNVSHAF